MSIIIENADKGIIFKMFFKAIPISDLYLQSDKTAAKTPSDILRQVLVKVITAIVIKVTDGNFSNM